MSYNKKTIEDIQVNGKKVLVRCDFNVPLKDGVITDENRLKGALPTIKYLIENGAKVILCSHLGKDASKSLAPVAVRLSEMLGKTVVFAADQEVVGENARKAVADMLHLPLDTNGNFAITTAEEASLLIRYLCFKIFQDNETKDVLESNTVKKLSIEYSSSQ